MIKTIYDIPEHIFKTSYQNATIGHVLTPPKLALEMIETLPSDFIKSGIKVLDPACKNGSFLFQLVIKQLDNDWMIKDIEKSLYTCDTLMASLNVAESGIKHIIRFPYQNSLIKINNLLYKFPSIEILYDELIKTITKNKYISIRLFINELLLDRKNNWLIVKFEENLIEFIKKYEGLSKTESKLFGEVFTPQALIEEMLDTLPADVWTNKDLKWLDPAVGIGNFPAAILNRLMKGLEEVIPDEDERRKHILEEMLYMGDISTKNLFLLYQLFDLNNEFKLNVFRGDFLGGGFDKQMVEWGLEGFDLVVGNPPYNDKLSTGNALWGSFILNGNRILNNDGIILFVVPGRWVLPGYNIKKGKVRLWDIFSKNNMICINLGKCSDYFDNVGSDKDYFSYFTYQKSKYNGNTKLITRNKEFYINILDIDWLPYKNCSDISLSIIKKIKKERNIFNISWKYDKSQSNLQNKETDENNIKVFLGDNNFKYSNHTSDNHSDKKIMFKLGRFIPYHKRVFIDYCGDVSFNSSYISIIKKGENYDYLNSKLYKFIGECLYNGSEITAEGFRTLPKLDSSKSWTDQELYQYFNLTPEEIQLIEETISEPTNKKKSKKK